MDEVGKVSMIELGDKVKDVVTGLEGRVLARLEALYEVVQYRVHQDHLSRDGKVEPSVWLEEGRLERLPDRKLVGFIAFRGDTKTV